MFSTCVANDNIADPANKQPIANSPTWREAVVDLLNFWIPNRRCFSSGEVAACLREHRPDLRFAHLNLGEHIRDLFYTQALPQYPLLDGGYTPPIMVSRETVGRYPTRTPANVQVFVYAPDQAAGDAHDFEVFVPNPWQGETMASAPPPAPPQPATKVGVLIGGAKNPVAALKAKVWPDNRLCIPRSAFEAAVHLAGRSIRGGDSVYVTFAADGSKVVVTLDDFGLAGTKAYALTTTSGRVAFHNPTTPFNPNDSYDMTVEAGAITIALV